MGSGGRYFLIFCDSKRKPEEKSVALKTSDGRVANKRAGELEKLYDRGEYDPWAMRPPWEIRGLTLAAAGEQFLDEKRKTLRPRSIRAYDLALRGLTAVVPSGLTLDELGPQHVRRYVTAPGLSGETHKHRLRHVSAFVNWARAADMIREGSDPLKGVRVATPEKRLPSFLRPEEIDRLVRTIDESTAQQRKAGRAKPGENLWLKDVVLFAAYTGLRRFELTSAQWEWVDLGSRTLTVRHSADFKTKGNRERAVPLLGPAWEVVERLAAEREATGLPRSGPLFVGSKGDQLDPSRASKRFKHFVREAGLNERLRFHDLRHSCGTLLATRGVPQVIIAAVLGHASTSTTAIYTHADASHVRQAMQLAIEGPQKPARSGMLRRRVAGNRFRSGFRSSDTESH